MGCDGSSENELLLLISRAPMQEPRVHSPVGDEVRSRRGTLQVLKCGGGTQGVGVPTEVARLSNNDKPFSTRRMR
jgi:hypothetical protein